MIIKKKDINPLLLNILFFKKDDKGNDYEAGGLLTEKMGLGAKRKLHKIRKELLTHSETLKEEYEAVRKEFKGKESDEDKKLLDEEMKNLLAEEVKLTSDPVMICEIEKIESSTNYDFELIELITEKCS